MGRDLRHGRRSKNISLSGTSLVPCAHRTDEQALDDANNLFVALETPSTPLCSTDGHMAFRSPSAA